VLDTLEPQIPEYLALKKYYNQLRVFLQQNPTLDTAQCKADNIDLIAQKLNALGFTTQDETSETTIKTALIKFQKTVSLDTSGKADKKTIAELNVPLSFRVQQLKQSLNCWRWTGRVAEKSFILVNIPAATLRIIQRDSTTELNMRVIVGKEQTRTPVFTAYISKVITYPYWTPTYSIASKEILPKVQKDISYLAKNNFTVLDKKGNEIDPATINWQSISPKNLPYTFRQGTGCDNSLGVMKFDLNSPFSIYLHDTNRRDLFTRNERHLSHGCIRLEKPFVLANYLLGDTVNTAYLNECLKSEKPREFKLNQKFPVLIFYMTADINKQGELQFFKDVYRKV
jgi:murein L,D-transpeptidase YcbB/YkuD